MSTILLHWEPSWNIISLIWYCLIPKGPSKMMTWMCISNRAIKVWFLFPIFLCILKRMHMASSPLCVPGDLNLTSIQFLKNSWGRDSGKELITVCVWRRNFPVLWCLLVAQSNKLAKFAVYLELCSWQKGHHYWQLCDFCHRDTDTLLFGYGCGFCALWLTQAWLAKCVPGLKSPSCQAFAASIIKITY